MNTITIIDLDNDTFEIISSNSFKTQIISGTQLDTFLSNLPQDTRVEFSDNLSLALVG